MAEPVRRPRTRFRAETLRPTDVQVLRVTAVKRPRASVVRVHLDAPPTWVSTGFDDVVVLCLPDPGTGEVVLPEALPGGVLRPPATGCLVAREYTVRRGGDLTDLVLDVVLHEQGPGAAWARAVVPGVEVGVVGPRLVRGPVDATRIEAVGDETAWPALCRLLEEWPDEVPGVVVAVLRAGWSVADLPAPPRGVTTQVVRASGADADDLAAVVSALAASRDATAGRDSVFAWVGGESSLATGARRWWVGPGGLDTDQVQFTGYWRRGASADQAE